jgi:acetyl-CoA carboxylase biotin carboxyl carrier protein
MDINDLKEILRLLEEREITQFELEQDGVKLRVCRSVAGNHDVSSPAGSAAASAPLTRPGASAVSPGAAAAPVAAGASAEGATAAAEGETLVKSPIVGTFFSAPDPNSPPFVRVGDQVRVGQVLCIIEAMKLMNEIEAEVAGEIVKVHLENGQPVQYGDPLFSLRTA